MRKITSLLTLIVLLAIALGTVYAQDDLPFESLYRRITVETRAAADAAAVEYQRTDQITTVLVGTASPISTSGAQTSTAVFVNGQFLLFDTGNGTMQSMTDANIPLTEVDAVFLTHYHYDHYIELADVVQMSWVQGRQHTLSVYGPPGLTQVMDGLMSAAALDASYRWLHHTEELMPPEYSGADVFEFEEPEGNEAIVVYEQDGVTVETFHVNHDPADPAVGFRVLYEDRLIVISGDTILTESLIVNSQDADLLVAATMNFDVVEIAEEINREEFGDERQAVLLFDIRDYLMDVSDVGELAQQANVERLALNHIAPNVSTDERLLNAWFVEPIAEIYDGEIIAGEDGTTIVIPLDEE
ncbi:MAG: MBL fold metallo-hydrolase [Chloroflexota bacterium]